MLVGKLRVHEMILPFTGDLQEGTSRPLRAETDASHYVDETRVGPNDVERRFDPKLGEA